MISVVAHMHVSSAAKIRVSAQKNPTDSLRQEQDTKSTKCENDTRLLDLPRSSGIRNLTRGAERTDRVVCLGS
jgi:hypothetical protein